jgi:hypothetical protein
LLRAYRASRDAESEVSDEPVPLTAVRRSVQGCYERVYRGRGTEGGRLVLDITVQDDGRVESVDVTEDSFDGSLDICIQTVVEKFILILDEGAGPTVNYPVIISPSAETELETGSEPTPPEAQSEADDR